MPVGPAVMRIYGRYHPCGVGKAGRFGTFKTSTAARDYPTLGKDRYTDYH